jgi:hypothetical protein
MLCSITVSTVARTDLAWSDLVLIGLCVSRMMSRLNSMPDEVLKVIMQYVPLNDRLASCCLVSRRLHAAAVAATQDVELTRGHLQSGLQWLSPYGQHVTNLTLDNLQQPLLELPCPNLLELRLLEMCSAQLGPAADGSPGVILGCTKLTCLEVACNIIDAPAGTTVDSLSRLVRLQKLTMEPKVGGTMYYINGVSVATLPRLTCLTFLEVSCLSERNLAQLDVLTNLQVLHLTSAVPEIGPNTVPGLVFPACITNLMVLGAVAPELLLLVPTGLKALVILGRDLSQAEGPGSLLLHIAQLPPLLQLDVSVEVWPAAGPAYSALTASSSLEFLGLSQATLPAGVWPHVFPVARNLPHLTRIDFDGAQGMPDVPSAMAAADILNLVRCCPNLCGIDALALQHGLHVSELCKLTALTSLGLQYADSTAHSSSASMRGLASVVQIQALTLDISSPVATVSSLLPLTSLTALTSLSPGWYHGTQQLSELDYTSSKVTWDISGTLSHCPYLMLATVHAAHATQLWGLE